MTPRATRAGDRVVILDGGVGSELRRRGAKLSTVCWSAEACLTHARLLRQIHLDYILAGADIVTANTFANTRFVLAAAGLRDRFGEVNRNAIAAVRDAAALAGRDVTVAASLSCLPPGFDASAYPRPDAECDAYRELADCFAGNGVELVLVEMMQQPEHAERVCRAVEAAGLPYWFGISCRSVGGRLVAFDDPAVAFESTLAPALRFSPEALAVMHSPLDAMIPALDALSGAWPGPIAAYAEIPYAEDPDAQGPVTTAPEAYAAAAARWLDHGATIIGGCCGTTPAHVAALRALVDA